MSENTSILQVPITSKTSEKLTNDTQKLVYVHIPKDKSQDLSHVKVLPAKSSSGPTSAANIIPLSGKINSTISSGFKKESSLPTSFTFTKTSKLSGGSNITFSQRPALSSISSKSRPSILGSKVKLSQTNSGSGNVPMNSNAKSIKVSLNNNRNFVTSSASSAFRTSNSINSSNIIVTQASSSTPNLSGNTITLLGSGSPTVTPLICSSGQVRSPSFLSQIPPKQPKSVILQSKILTGPKQNTSKVVPVSQKIGSVSLSNKAGAVSNKTVVSYGTIIPSGGVISTTSESSGGVKREYFSTSKREGGNFNSFTPPPLILQSGNNSKKLANKKTGPTTISIVTGKSPNSNSGISVYPLSRTGNLNKPNMINFKIANGQIQSENSMRFDGLICDSRPMLVSSSLSNLDSSDSALSEDDGAKDSSQESTTFFKKAPSSVSKQCEQKDILQEAMSAMVSDNLEDASSAASSTNSEPPSNYSSCENKNTPTSSQPMDDVSNSDKKSNSNLPNRVPQTLHESIPILVSNSVPVGGSAPMLLQGTMPVPGSSSLPGPVSVQGLFPVKVQPSSSTSSASLKPDVQGLIIRTDSVTVRRKVGKEETKKDVTKPDLSIIPILRNSSMESKGSSSPAKSQRLNLLAMEPIKETPRESSCSNEGELAVSSSDVKMEDNSEKAEVEDKESDEVKELLKWENGTGSLIGSDLKFTLNEFDAVELVEDGALDEIKSQITSLPQNGESFTTSASSAMEVPLPPSSTSSAAVEVQVSKPLPTTVHIHHARKPNLSRKEEENPADSTTNADIGSKSSKNPYDICCCKNCGCYGLSSEFFKEKGNSFCTIACSEDYTTKEAEWNKEKQRLEKSKSRLKKVKPNDREPAEKCDSKPKDSKEQLEPETTTKEEISAPSSAKDIKEEPAQTVVEPSPTKFQHPWQDTKNNSFSWVKYLEHCGKNKGVSRGAPLRLWNEPFPFGKNLFKAGMKLEGIDPQHQSLFNVMTVVDVIGHRIRLHFDGYSEMYDFWINANSPNIFQVGWCEKNGRKLETPPGIFNFTWKAYLDHCKASPAPRQAFATRNCTTITPPSNFRIGMKLEAEDRKNGWTCVATVADLLDSRVLVHFDGWEKAFDTWFDITSPFIHPIGWCSKNDVYLYPPKDYPNPDSFNWHEYLQETNSMGVPARAFKTRPTRDFKVDLKFEAVDKRNPMLVRVATIADTKDYKVLLHFDGWPDMYDYWIDDDSPDIHPPTWCNKTGHPLQPPLTPEQCAEDVDSGVGCGTPGCKGYGHVKGLIYNTHHTAYGCPYSVQNLNKDWESMLPDRLDPPSKERSKKLKGSSKPYINLDASKPIPEHLSEDLQRKRVRKRRKFFDELSPPEGTSKPKISRISSDEFGSSNSASTNRSQTMPKPTPNPVSNTAPNSSSQSMPSTSGSSGQTNVPAEMPTTSSSKKQGSWAPLENVDTMVHQSIFNPGYHPNPPAPLPHSLDRHKHIISGLKDLHKSELDGWGPEEVREAISKIPGCESASEKFIHQDIDGESLLMLTQNDLIDLLGIKLGPAIKIMGLIFSLKSLQ